MYINADVIIRIAAFITAMGTLGAFLYKGFRWMEKQNRQDEVIEKMEGKHEKAIKELSDKHNEDIESIKKEQCVMCYALLATLNGLKQLGANGNVTDAHDKLEKHLNKTAHD